VGEEGAEEEEQNKKKKKKKRKRSHDFWSDACIFIYRMIQDLGAYSVGQCEKNSSYEHVSNSERLLRERCLNPQT